MNPEHPSRNDATAAQQPVESAAGRARRVPAAFVAARPGPAGQGLRPSGRRYLHQHERLHTLPRALRRHGGGNQGLGAAVWRASTGVQHHDPGRRLHAAARRHVHAPQPAGDGDRADRSDLRNGRRGAPRRLRRDHTGHADGRCFSRPTGGAASRRPCVQRLVARAGCRFGIRRLPGLRGCRARRTRPRRHRRPRAFG